MAQEPLGLRCLWFSHRFARTHSGILTSRRSRPTFPRALLCYGNAPLPLCLATQGQASAGRLIPTILGASPLGERAIPHSLKEWLHLSQPPRCHTRDTSFAILSGHFGALAVALGSFPLAAGHYRSATASRGRSHRYSEFGWGW